MDMRNERPIIRVNISFLPFNEAKIVGGEFEQPEMRQKTEQPKIPKYYVPITTGPLDFETRFDGDGLYSVPTTSG